MDDGKYDDKDLPNQSHRAPLQRHEFLNGQTSRVRAETVVLMFADDVPEAPTRSSAKRNPVNLMKKVDKILLILLTRCIRRYC